MLKLAKSAPATYNSAPHNPGNIVFCISMNYFSRKCKVFCCFVRANVVICKGGTDLGLTGMRARR